MIVLVLQRHLIALSVVQLAADEVVAIVQGGDVAVAQAALGGEQHDAAQRHQQCGAPLGPPADLAALLGQQQDDDMVVYGSDTDEPPYFAIGFRAKKAGGSYKYIWLYKVKFAIPSESYQTKGDSIEFTTPEITGQFIKRPDGLWKAEHVALPTETAAQGWFTKVREQNNTSGG